MCVYQYHYLIMCVNYHPTIIALLRRMNSTTLKDRTEQLNNSMLKQLSLSLAEKCLRWAEQTRKEAFKSFHVGMLMWQTENELRSDLFLKKLLIRQSAPWWIGGRGLPVVTPKEGQLTEK